MNLGHVQQYDPCVQNDKSLVVVPSAVGVEDVGVPSLFARHNSGSSTHDEWKDSLSFMARFGLDLYTPGGRCPMVKGSIARTHMPETHNGDLVFRY